MASVYYLSNVFQYIIYRFDNTSLARHDFVVHVHQTILHIAAYARHDVDASIEKRFKKRL